MHRIYTDKEKEYLSNTKLSSKDVSLLTGISQSTIKAYRQRNNIYIEQYKISNDNATIQQFIKDYQLLKSESRMAKKYNVNHHTIADYVKRHNLEYLECKKHILTNQEIQYILDAHDSKSSKMIAEELHIHISTITALWHRYGLKKTERRKYPIDQTLFENIDSDYKAYLLGFIASDGCLYVPNNAQKQKILSITIHKQDKEILELFQKAFKTTKPISKQKDYVNFNISSTKVINDIAKLGITPQRKTYGNIIPKINPKYFFAFIRGMIDGDGSILNNSITISGYENNMQQIQQFLLTHNIFTSFVIDKRKHPSNETNKMFGQLVTPNRTSMYCLLKEIYKNKNEYFLSRKYLKAQTFMDSIENSQNIRDKQIVIYYKYAVQKVS